MRRLRATSLVSVALMSVLFARDGGAAGGNPTISLTQVSTWGGEPDIDVNPTNANRLVVGAQGNGYLHNGMGLYPTWALTNPGHPWTQATGIGPQAGSDPAIEFDGIGNIYFSMVNPVDQVIEGTSLNRGVLVAKSTDGGLTYPTRSYALDGNSSFVLADGSPIFVCQSVTGTFFDQPKLAVDKASNRVYCFAISDGLDRNHDGVCDPGAACVIVRSVNGGVSWSDGHALPNYFTNLCVASNGAVYLAGANYVGGACASQGRRSRRCWDCSDRRPATPSSHTRHPVRRPQVGTTGLRRSICRSSLMRSTPSDPTKHLYIVRSTNAGASWGLPVRVDDMVGNDMVDHVYPSISVSTAGRLDVAWYDYRFSTPTTFQTPGQPGDVFYTYSTDGGNTWAQSLRLSTATAPAVHSGANDYLTVVSSGKKAYVAFALDSDADGHHETYVSTISFK